MDNDTKERILALAHDELAVMGFDHNPTPTEIKKAFAQCLRIAIYKVKENTQ